MITLATKEVFEKKQGNGLLFMFALFFSFD